MCFIDWLLKYGGLSSLLTFCAISIALLPIFRELIHKIKYKRILREQIFIEVRDIHQSYLGKKEHFKGNWKTKELGITIPEHDKDFFKRLSLSFEKATYLNRKERVQIGKLLQTYRKGSYKKTASGKDNVINPPDVDILIEQSKGLLDLLEKKISK